MLRFKCTSFHHSKLSILFLAFQFNGHAFSKNRKKCSFVFIYLLDSSISNNVYIYIFVFLFCLFVFVKFNKLVLMKSELTQNKKMFSHFFKKTCENFASHAFENLGSSLSSFFKLACSCYCYLSQPKPLVTQPSRMLLT